MPLIEISIAGLASEQFKELRSFLQRIERKLTMTADEINAITAQVAKIGTETTATLAKVAELEEALANAGEISPEVQAAFDALKAQVQVVDDLVVDPAAPTA